MINLKDYFQKPENVKDAASKIANFVAMPYNVTRFFGDKIEEGGREFTAKMRGIEEQKKQDYLNSEGIYADTSLFGSANQFLDPMRRAAFRTTANIIDNVLDINSSLRRMEGDVAQGDYKNAIINAGNAASSGLAATPVGTVGQAGLGLFGGLVDTFSPSTKQSIDRTVENVGTSASELFMTKEELETINALERKIEGGYSLKSKGDWDDNKEKKLQGFIAEHKELTETQGAAANVLVDLVTFGAGNLPKLNKFTTPVKQKFNDYFPSKPKEQAGLVDLTQDKFNNIKFIEKEVKDTVKFVYKANKDLSKLPDAVAQAGKLQKKYYPDDVQVGDLSTFKYDKMTDLYFDGKGNILDSMSMLERVNKEFKFTNEGKALNKKRLQDAQVSEQARVNAEGIYRANIAKMKEIDSARAEYNTRLDEATTNYRNVYNASKNEVNRLVRIGQKLEKKVGLNENQLAFVKRVEDLQSIKAKSEIVSPEYFTSDLGNLNKSIEALSNYKAVDNSSKFALAKAIENGIKNIDKMLKSDKKGTVKLRKQAKSLYNKLIRDKFKTEQGFKNALRKTKDKKIIAARNNAQKTIKSLLLDSKKASNELKQTKKDLYYKIQNFEPQKSLTPDAKKSIQDMKNEFVGKVMTVGPEGKTDTKAYNKLQVKDLERTYNKLLAEQYYHKVKQRFTKASQKLDVANLSKTVANDLSAIPEITTNFQIAKDVVKRNLGSLYPNSNVFAILSKTGKYDINSTLYKVFKEPLNKAWRNVETRKHNIATEINQMFKKLDNQVASNIRIYIHQAKVQGLDVQPLKNHRLVKDNKIDIDNVNLTEAELALYNKMNSMYEELYPELNAFNKLYNNEDLGYIKNYANMFVEDVEVKTLDKNDLVKLFKNTRPSSKANFFKKRAGDGTLQDITPLAVDNFMSYVNKSLYLTQQVPVLRKLTDVLNKGDIASKNPTAHKILTNYIEGQMPKGTSGEMSKFINYVKKNTYAMYLLGSVKLVMYQPFAYLLSAGAIKPTELPRYMADSTEFFANFTKNKKFIDDNMADIRFRQGGEQVMKDITLESEAQKFAGKAISIADSAAAYPAAYAFYKQAKRRGYKDTDAFNYAQEMVNKTQGSGFGKDVGSHLKNDWARLFLMFRTMTMAMGGTLAELTKNNPGQALLFASGMFANEAMVDAVKTVYSNVLFDENEDFQGFGETAFNTFLSVSPSPISSFELQSGRTFPDPLSDPVLSTYKFATDPSLKNLESFYKYVPYVPKVGAGTAFDIIEAITD